MLPNAGCLTPRSPLPPGCWSAASIHGISTTAKCSRCSWRCWAAATWPCGRARRNTRTASLGLKLRYSFIEVFNALQAHPRSRDGISMNALAVGEQFIHQVGHGKKCALGNEIEGGAAQAVDSRADRIFGFRFFGDSLDCAVNNG